MDKRVDDFISKYPSWRERLCRDELHLAIPSLILEEIGETRVRNTWWEKNPDRMDEEKQFSKMMEAISGGIGVRNGQIMQFPPLGIPPSISEVMSKEEFEELDWDKELSYEVAQQAQAEAEKGKLPSIRARILGYAGWLVTNPKYRQDIENLKKEFELSNASLPIQRTNEPGESLRNNLFTKGQEFLAKWGLNSLADWYFPCPQGPLFGEHEVLQFIKDTRFPGIALYIPAWYAVLDDKDDILKELKSHQKHRFKDLLADDDDWPITKHARFAGIFLCHYVWLALNSREKMAPKNPGYDDIMWAISFWLDERLPEKRGGANRGKGEGGAENQDRGSRARRLISTMNTRIRRKK
jgi:hypothetical protein